MGVTFVAIFTAAVLTAVIIFEVVKILLYKTFTLSDAALQIVLTIFSIAYVVFASKFDKPILENVLSAILCFAHASSLAIALFYFVEQTRMYLAYNKKLSKFLKDTEYDFFIQVNKKNKIKDYGVALLKTVGLT